MGKILAVFLEIEEEENIITGGERQLQEMIRGLRRNGVDVLCVGLDGALEAIDHAAASYEKGQVYIISDYSKRFRFWKLNWHFRYRRGFHICCTVGAFYFDYRTSKLKNAIDYLISYLYLKPADLIFTTGKAVSGKLRKMGCRNKRIQDVYPAIREDLIAQAKQGTVSAKAGGEKIVLTVGRFHPVKGYDYLLDAVKYCEELSDVHFLLVGDYTRKPDDYYQRIAARVRREGLSERITIYGRTKDDSELADLYRRAWCCLHTSVWESSPITVCEALLFGKPVIATNVGGTPEYLSDGVDSLLVPAKDGAAIGEALSRLYHDGGLYDRLCANARKSAKNYINRAWTDVGEEYYGEFQLR